MLTQAPRGTRDVLPTESYRWQYIEGKMRAAAALAGYREVRTPVFEHTELFARGVGDTTDIVQKEMYTFQDKGNRSITLKPEGTAGAARCFLESNLYADALPCKMYYLNAPIFRYEAPQNGRLREHHQFGLECFGAPEATADAELILLAFRLLSELGIQNLSVNINSIGCPNCRPKYHGMLKDYLADRVEHLCEDCKNRFERNPLRVLDCKKPGCQAQVKDAPSMLDVLCDDCKAHFEQLQACLDAAGVPYRINSRIVRGLDYYTKTVFELITTTKDGNLTVCGGGRYDHLVEQLGGPDLPAVGFGMGLERVLMLLDAEGIQIPEPAHYEVFVTYMGDHRIQAFHLVESLRNQGIRADMDHCGRSLKAQFKYANKTGAPISATIGDEEAENGTVKLKNMATREECTVPVEEAGARILEMRKDEE
ncbi:MAG: histidine--tRNA ligase [Clostridia bacterium]|nr:histidine--tRNA ligase [Clostridia bacterium]